LFDTFGSEVNPISSEIPSETKEGGAKKNPKKEPEKAFTFLAPHGDFPCLSKGTVIQDALHLKCAICGNWHLIRGLKHRQKKMVYQGFLDTSHFFNSLVDPMSSRAGSIQPHFLKQV